MIDAGERYRLLIENARVEVSRGNPSAAETYLTEAIAVGEWNFGAEDPRLCVALNELSRLYVRQSDFLHAEPILLRLVRITRSKGDRHPDVATALAGLAVAKRGLGDDIGAELLFRRALRMREEALAPNHMSIVITLEQLSDACAARGKYAEALVNLQRALLRREQVLGADHATVRGLRARIAGLERRHAEWMARAAERATNPPVPAIERAPAPSSARESESSSLDLASSLAEPLARSAVQAWSTLTASAAGAAPWKPASRSRRASRYASGVAAVAVLVIAGFAFRSPSRHIGVLADDASSQPIESAAIEPAHHDSVSVLTASGAYDAPMGAAALRLAGNPASDVPTAPAALPRLRKLVVPRVAMPSLDSVLRTSATDDRAVDAEPIGAGSNRAALDDAASVTPPVLIGSAPTARYPDELRAQRVEGDVVVQFRVNEQGRVEASSMQVIQSPHPLFSDAVRSVLPRFRFEPAHAGAPGSKPQAAWVQFHTRFTAQR
jgi:TonB family protein